MAYSAGIRMGQRSARANRYRRVNPGVALKGFFVWIFRLVGASLLVAMSLLFVVIISIALLYGYRTIMTSDYFSLKNIEITGNRQLTYAQLTQMMDISPGENMLQLRMSELHSRVAANPWVKSVSVKREFPETLVISINERQAYFWLQDGDRISYADERGRIITRVSPDRFVSLPVLMVEGDFQPEDISSLVSFLENRRFPFPLQDISWVRLRQSGTIEMGHEELGLVLSIDSENIKRGPARLTQVWNDIRSRGEVGSVDRITVAGRHVWVKYGQNRAAE